MAPTVDIYFMAESPPCRMVEMVASLINVKLNKHNVSLAKKEHLSEEHAKINTRCKIPFIIDGDLKMNESRAIMTYLVNKYSPGNALYPNDPVLRARIDELLHYDLGTLFPDTSGLIGSKIFGDVNAPMNPEKEKAYKRDLSYLEQRLAGNGGKSFMLGDDLTVADIALSTTLLFASAGCEYNIDSFASLVSYLARVRAAIPSYAEINDEACSNTRKYIQSRREAANKNEA